MQIKFTQAHQYSAHFVSFSQLQWPNNGQSKQEISVAFLHAKAATKDLFMWPPQEFCNDSWQTVWRLHKAMYGLRSSSMAKSPSTNPTRSQYDKTEKRAKVYTKQTTDQHTFLYTLAIYFLLDKTISSMICFQQYRNNWCSDLQVSYQRSKQSPSSDETLQTKVIITKSTSTKIIQQQCWKKQARQHAKQQQPQGRQQTRRATKTMTTYPSTKTSMHSTEESWENYNGWPTQVTRPDLSFATKELARSLQQPTYLDMKKMKHTLRYVLHCTLGDNSGKQ